MLQILPRPRPRRVGRGRYAVPAPLRRVRVPDASCSTLPRMRSTSCAKGSKASAPPPASRSPISTSRSSPRPPCGSISRPTAKASRRPSPSSQPRLLVLDPFVRLHRIDENASGEVAPLARLSARTAAPPRRRRGRRPPRQEGRRPRPRRPGPARLVRVPRLGRFQSLSAPQWRTAHANRRAPRRARHAHRHDRARATRRCSGPRGRRSAHTASAGAKLGRRAHHRGARRCQTTRCRSPNCVRAAASAPLPSTSASPRSLPPAASASPTRVIVSAQL